MCAKGYHTSRYLFFLLIFVSTSFLIHFKINAYIILNQSLLLSIISVGKNIFTMTLNNVFVLFFPHILGQHIVLVFQRLANSKQSSSLSLEAPFLIPKYTQALYMHDHSYKRGESIFQKSYRACVWQCEDRGPSKAL